MASPRRSLSSSSGSSNLGSCSTFSTSIADIDLEAFVSSTNVPAHLASGVFLVQEVLEYNHFLFAYLTTSLAESKKKSRARTAMLNCFVQPTTRRFVELIESIVDSEIDRCVGHEELLFRDNASFSTRFLDLLLHRYGNKFCKGVLSSVSYKFKPSYLEVNPAKEPRPERLAQNIANVKTIVDQIFAKLVRKAPKFPPAIAYIAHLLSSRLVSSGSSRAVISTLLFLKLLCPLICSGKSPISKCGPTARITIAKVIQAIANGQPFDEAHSLSCFNSYIKQSDTLYIQLCSSVLALGANVTKPVDVMSQRQLVQQWLVLIEFLSNNSEELKAQCLEQGGEVTPELACKQFDRALQRASKAMPQFLLFLSGLD